MRDFGEELTEAMEQPAFRAILDAVRHYARMQGISERQAAEGVVQSFRKLDKLWTDYVIQEGIDRLRQ